MPILLRLLLLLLAGASIVGARRASRHTNAQFMWPATPARPATSTVHLTKPPVPTAIARLTSGSHGRQLP